MKIISRRSATVSPIRSQSTENKMLVNNRHHLHAKTGNRKQFPRTRAKSTRNPHRIVMEKASFPPMLNDGQSVYRFKNLMKLEMTHYPYILPGLW